MAKNRRLLCVHDLEQGEIIKTVEVTQMPFPVVDKLVAYVRRQLDPKRYRVDVAWYSLYIKTPDSDFPRSTHWLDAWFSAKSFWDTHLGKPWKPEEI